jgi:hypothetical protein
MAKITPDRSIELATALFRCPWVDPIIRKICDEMIKKWEVEDMAQSNVEKDPQDGRK